MKTLAAALLFITILPGCSDDDTAKTFNFEDDPAITSLKGTWKVISFEDFVAKTVERKTQENSWGGDIIITFDDEQEPHNISGQNITNAVFGQFEYRQARRFKMLSLGSTMVAQPAWADEFSQAITGENVDYMINPAKLRIFYHDGAKSVTLLKL